MSQSLVQERSALKIRFEKFPLWEGVQDKPVAQRCYPFQLEVDGRGYIRQRISSELEKAITERYQAASYSVPTRPPGASNWADRRGGWHLSFIERHIPTLQGKHVMEIGAGSTVFSEYFTHEKHVERYVIIDPSVHADGHNPRVHVIADYFSKDLNVGNEHPNLIIAIICLQYIADPFSFLRKVRELLQSADSRAVFTIPDIEAQFQRGDINALFFEHLNYFSQRSVTSLFKQAGLEVVELEKKHDTLFYVLRKMEEYENSDGVPMKTDAELLHTASVEMHRVLHAAEQFFHTMHEKGKVVGCHGACNGLNTLFTLGTIQSDGVYLFDGDESKVGKFLPACPIPILASTSPRYAEIDYVVVTATTFFDEIREFLLAHHSIPAERIFSLCSLPDHEKNF